MHSHQRPFPLGAVLRISAPIFLLTTTAVLATPSTGRAQSQRPNIVFILSDDVGFNDIGFNSALHGRTTPFRTPNLDALANQSVVARQAYSTGSLCGISRAGLLTGNYSQRLGIEENLGNDLAQTFGLHAEDVLLPERLKALGYSTGMVGKWHEGYTAGVNRPLDSGFDEFFGFLSGSRGYYLEGGPANLMLRGNTIVENQWRTQGNPALYDPTRGRYVTDAFGEESVDYINRHAHDANPFFLYASFTASHIPSMAKQQDYDQFANIANTDKRTLAAMTYALDRNVGSILDALETNGLADNTIVIYSNDNGGTHLHDNGALRGFKGYAWEGGIRVPFAMRAPGLTPGVYDKPITMHDMVPTLVAAAGGEAPTDDVVGTNLMPYFSGQTGGNPHEVMFWRNFYIWGVRKGDWKLTRPNEEQFNVFALYNMAADPSEQVNLINQQPAIVAELSRELTKWEATLRKPEYFSLGANNRNHFDHFVFRNDLAASTNWSTAGSWRQAGTSTAATLLRDDLYANGILEFTTRNDANYTAVNDMVRMSKMIPMANQIRLTGQFDGATARTGTINGNAVLMVKSLAGSLPRIQLDATKLSSADFKFNLDTEIQLYDNLEITGDGTEEFVINGAIKDYYEPRGLTKSGTAQAVLTANNTFTGNLVVTEGTVRLQGTGSAISGAARVQVDGAGKLTLAGGLVRTGTLDLSGGGQFQFDSGTVELIGAGSYLGPGTFDVGTIGKGTLTLAAGADATTSTLRIGADADGELLVPTGATLATQSDATIAYAATATAGSRATVTGAGASWTVSGDLDVARHGKAELIVSNGGAVQVAGAAVLAAEAGSIAVATVGGAGAASQWKAGGFNIGGAGGAATLEIKPNGVVDSTGVTAIQSSGVLRLAGGELRTDSFDNSHGGTFDWQSGKVNFTGVQGLSIGTSDALGSTVALTAGKTLQVMATTTIGAGGSLEISGGEFSTGVLMMEGGSFTAPNLNGVGIVRYQSGQLTLANSAGLSVGLIPGGVTGAAGGVVGPGGIPISEVVLQTGDAWNVTGPTTLPAAAILRLTGGTIQTSQLNLTGGALYASNLDGIGSLNFSAGLLAVTDDLTIGPDGMLGDNVEVASGQTIDVVDHLYVGTESAAGTLEIKAGGAVSAGTATTISALGAIQLNGGKLSTPVLANVAGGAFTWTSGTMEFTAGLDVSSTGDLGSAVSLTSNRTLRVLGAATVDAGASLAIEGGALSVGQLTIDPAATFTWTTGALEMVGDATVSSGGVLERALGSQMNIGAGRHLGITGAATLETPLQVGGGRLSVGQLVNAQFLNFDAGTLDLTGADLYVGEGGVFGSVLTVRTGAILNVAHHTTVDASSLVEIQQGTKLTSGTLTNDGEIELQGSTAELSVDSALNNAGIIRGRGRISGAVVNSAAGSVLVAGGDRLRFLGPSMQNAGHVSALGTAASPAEVEFAGTAGNELGAGLITGVNARFRFEDGVENDGSIALTGGDNHVFGDIDNEGELIVTGGAAATFYGDIANAGVIRVAKMGETAATAVFLGDVSGAGGTTGGGEVYFEGDLRPGVGATTSMFDSNVHLGSQSALEIDLAGIAPGGFDRVEVSGSLTLAGELAVLLTGGFTPQAGQSFEIIAAEQGLTGAFETLLLPALATTDSWKVDYDVDSVTLSVVGSSGDFDSDGQVDGSDFLLWQRNLGVTSGAQRGQGDANGDGAVNASDLAIWETQFGSHPGASLASTSIPEPASLVILGSALLAQMAARRKRR
jgi:T5SS/PEP-CTERM-associated repeat protein/autotransporter-associated beta strand protein